jgi:hypothetical protein
MHFLHSADTCESRIQLHEREGFVLGHERCHAAMQGLQPAFTELERLGIERLRGSYDWVSDIAYMQEVAYEFSNDEVPRAFRFHKDPFSCKT